MRDPPDPDQSLEWNITHHRLSADELQEVDDAITASDLRPEAGALLRATVEYSCAGSTHIHIFQLPAAAVLEVLDDGRWWRQRQPVKCPVCTLYDATVNPPCTFRGIDWDGMATYVPPVREAPDPRAGG